MTAGAMSQLPGWLVMLPLAMAVSMLLLPPRLRAPASLAGGLAMAGLAAALLTRFAEHGPLLLAMGGWPVPLGIALMVDGPALGMVWLSLVVCLPCMLHAGCYLRGQAEGCYFWPLLWFMWAALNTIWMSADIFNLYVGIELLGLAAVGLVALRGDAPALAAAMRYLLAALVGSLAYLLGVALLYGGHGSLALAELALADQAQATTAVALVAMSVGLALKTALFPLHSWLPPAHGGALTPVSALLSALVIKASLFIMLRLWLTLSPPGLPLAAGALGALGAMAVFWGGWQALRQAQLKPLVAYSTVAQIGYLFLFFPLAIGASAEAARLAWDGMMLLLVSHALAKAAMFLAAGNLILAIGSPHLADLAGIGRYRQFSLLSFGLAGVSIMGLPPSGGFGGKWLLLQAALAGGNGGWAAVLLGGGLLSAAYVFRVFRQAFIEAPTRDRFVRPPPTLELTAFALALASLLIGLAAHTPLAWLRIGTPFAVDP